MQQTHSVEVSLYVCDVDVLVLKCGTICHIENGLMSVRCKRVSHTEAVIGAGTMHLAFQSVAQCGA
jgi:hypothetical protein